MPAWFEVAAVAAPEIIGSTVAADAALSDILAQQAAAAAMGSAGIGALGGLAGAGAPGLGGLAGYEAFLEQLTALNPEIVSQNQAITQAAAVPMSGPTVGGPIATPAADPSTMATAGQGAGNIVANQMAPQTAASAFSGMPAPTAADIAQMADVGMPPVEPFSFTSPLKPLYDLYKKQDPLTQDVMRYGGYGLGALQAAKYLNKTPGAYSPPAYNGPLSKFTYSPSTYTPYNYRPYAAGGPVEEMSRENAIGANTGYPQADINQGAYATPWQTPVSRNVISGSGDANVDQMTGIERLAHGGVARFDDGGVTGAAGDDGGSQSAEASAYSPSMYGPMMYSPSMMSTSLVDPAEAYAAAQPTMDMSRQNFQNFLARYQNLPITEAAPPPVVYQGLYAGEGPKAPAEPEWGGYSGASGGSVSPAGFGSGGGIANLGDYSDGGRLLKGPGDGMSDNIPATISGKQPARLADGEFVVPADVVSGLGNGSTDAGAKHLYSMMDKVRQARTGTKKQGRQIKPGKYLPA